MHIRFNAIFVVCLCVAFAGGCAVARNGTELKSTFDKGVAAYDARDFAQAFEIFKSIDEEDVAAMRNEGYMLRQGSGTAKDPSAARNVLKRAAELGLPTAQYDLAEMLMSGELGTPDVKAALPWLTLSASAHHPIAMYRMAELYEQGTLVAMNVDTARTLYAEAAAAGVPNAKERLAALGGPLAGQSSPEMHPATP